MDLSIIIVNYNTRQLTLECIQSIYESITSYTYEIIVVDNDSSDDSVPMIKKHYPKVNVIENKENTGFAVANNQAMDQSQGRYVLLLNSDTTVEENTFQVMIDFMEQHLEVGVSGCKIVLPDGSLDKACRRGFPTPWAAFTYAFGLAKLFPDNPKFTQYHLSHLNPDEEYPVDCLVGAFMLLRREVIDQVGMLDETFFMYGEDIDWCYRIKQAGWEIYYYPKTKIIHHKGASSRKKKRNKIIYEFHRAMWVFHRKHYWKKYSWPVHISVLAGIGLKWASAMLKNALVREQKI